MLPSATIFVHDFMHCNDGIKFLSDLGTKSTICSSLNFSSPVDVMSTLIEPVYARFKHVKLF